MKKFSKQLVAVTMATAMFFSQAGISAMASSSVMTVDGTEAEVISVEESTEEVTEEITEETSVVETTVEETTEMTTEETTMEDSEVETTDEADVEETIETTTEETTVEETTEMTTEETTVEETTEETTVEETTVEETAEDALFPGLPAEVALSSAQMADKEALAGFATDITGYVSGKDYVEGEILVEAANREDAQMYAEAYGGVLSDYNEKRGIARITLAQGITVKDAVAASIKDAKNVDRVLPAAWPNYLKYTCEETAEPASAISNYSDTKLDEQWFHEYMGSEYAWRSGYTGSGVKVAVIDTGIRKSHEDLSVNTVAGKNFSSGASGTADTDDYQGHGTHVAGIIAADGNNGKGGSGIAPDATLRSYRVFGSSGGASDYDTIKAIDAAVADGNDIINMSLGGPGYYKPYHTALQNAIKAGVAVFVAAGNEFNNSRDVYPANYKEVCTIGALNLSGGAATFSNFGSQVDLAFPGVDIYSTIIEKDTDGDGYTEVVADNNLYGNKNGTSMACPAAAGAAAVILSANPKALQGKTGAAKVNALINLMKNNAKKSSSAGMGKGTTYIPWACGLAAENKAPIAPTFNVKAGTYASESISVNISAEKNKVVYYSTNGKNPSFKNGNPVNGTRYTGTAVTITGKGAVTLKAIAVNESGKVSKVTSAKYVLKPTPKSVSIASANGMTAIQKGKTLSLKATVAPSYAVSAKVKWRITPENQGVTVNAKGVVSAKKTATAGAYTVYAQSVDAKGNPYASVAEAKFTVNVLESAGVAKLQATQKTVKVRIEEDGVSLNLNDYVIAKDAAGNEVALNGTYNRLIWKSSKTSVVTDNGYAQGAGTAKLTGTMADGSGKKVVLTVNVTKDVYSINVTGAKKLAKGKKITLTATVSPANVSNKKVDWVITPSNQGVTVNSKGVVTATAKAVEGNYTIQAKAKDESGVVSNSYVVTVIGGSITSIKLPKSATIFTKAGNTGAQTAYLVTPTITGTTGFDAGLVSYKSSNEGIATVAANGKVTAKAVGKTVITVMATDGSNKKATMTINVNIPVSDIKIAPKGGATKYVGKGKSIQYGALVYGEYGNPTNTKVTWSVADSSIAKVDKNGKVTGLKKGTTTLYATAADGSGVKASYNIEVIKAASRFRLVKRDGNYGHVFVFDTDSEIINKTAAYKVEVSGPGCSVYVNYIDAVEVVYTKPGINTFKVKVTLLDGSNKTATYTQRLWIL